MDLDVLNQFLMASPRYHLELGTGRLVSRVGPELSTISQIKLIFLPQVRPTVMDAQGHDQYICSYSATLVSTA